eukprot:COSAG02_NODE_1668_length_11402_cov_21.101743_1_plen_69_part_00
MEFTGYISELPKGLVRTAGTAQVACDLADFDFVPQGSFAKNVDLAVLVPRADTAPFEVRQGKRAFALS